MRAVHHVARQDVPSWCVGAQLAASFDRVTAAAQTAGFDIGETHAMGDRPLVLLTALQHPSPRPLRSAE